MGLSSIDLGHHEDANVANRRLHSEPGQRINRAAQVFQKPLPRGSHNRLIAKDR